MPVGRKTNMTTQNISQEWLFVAAFFMCLAVGLIPGLLKHPRKSEMPLEMDGKVVISTKETFYHARLMPRFSILLAVIAIFFVTWMITRYDEKLLTLLTAAMCLFSLALPLINMKIKEVAIVDGGLSITDFLRSVTVPFSQIKEVKAGRSRATAAYVFVEFEAKGPFGKKIYFMPVNRLEIKKRLGPLGVKYTDSLW